MEVPETVAPSECPLTFIIGFIYTLRQKQGDSIPIVFLPLLLHASFVLKGKIAAFSAQ